MNLDSAISVSHISKSYSIGVQKDQSLKGTLSSFIESKSSSPKEEFWALKNVTFEIKKGEVVGIIGRNGAGKSTLLKILSQITKPTTGRIEIYGRVASLLEVGTGFHPELTGRENIYLNGTILGMTRQEVKEKFDEIVEFSGVQKFIDTPVKHYSSGMYVRLAFAVAAHLEPEILIIDEVLAVGDADFQRKCIGKMKEVAGAGRTVIFVSHNLPAVENLCSKAFYLKEGELSASGETLDVIHNYESDFNKPLKSLLNINFGDLTIRKLSVKNNFDKDNNFSIGSSLNLELSIFSNSPVQKTIYIRYQIFNSKKDLVTTINSIHFGSKIILNPNKGCSSVCITDYLNLSPNDYFIGITIYNDELKEIFREDNFHTFSISPSDFYGTGKFPSLNGQGIILLKSKWSTIDDAQ